MYNLIRVKYTISKIEKKDRTKVNNFYYNNSLQFVREISIGNAKISIKKVL